MRFTPPMVLRPCWPRSSHRASTRRLPAGPAVRRCVDPLQNSNKNDGLGGLVRCTRHTTPTPHTAHRTIRAGGGLELSVELWLDAPRTAGTRHAHAVPRRPSTMGHGGLAAGGCALRARLARSEVRGQATRPARRAATRLQPAKVVYIVIIMHESLCWALPGLCGPPSTEVCSLVAWSIIIILHKYKYSGSTWQCHWHSIYMRSKDSVASSSE